MQIGDGLVQRVRLLKPLLWYSRLDVYPFILLYTLGFYLAMPASSFLNQYVSSNASNTAQVYAGLVLLPISFALHMLVFLLAQNSVEVRCWMGYSEVRDMKNAQYVLVYAAKNAGKNRFVKLHSIGGLKDGESVDIQILDQSFSITKNRLDFQKVTYNCDSESSQRKGTLQRLDYPVSGPLSAFLRWRGHQSDSAVHRSLVRWGLNEFDIPIPNFLDLYLDHLVAPFFVFQVICLFLWSLDDYWYYSFFTLLMLMFFEGMMCRQRQNSLLMLRNMRRPPTLLHAFRNGAWKLLSSELLVPGDIISVTSDETMRSAGRNRRVAAAEEEDLSADFASGDFVFPCDAMLLRGSCVVNEAMLTGESVPQMKESILSRCSSGSTISNSKSGGGGGNSSAAAVVAGVEDEDVDLGTAESNIDAGWKRHILFAGTALLLNNSITASATTTTNTTATATTMTPVTIPDAPDCGCVALVLRTGFGTSQGALMRKILFATERVSGGNAMETFFFIAALVVFAVAAAAAVLFYGLSDERRNKFRLVLHCIMIVTSVVPPELPMELSLAVTNSLAALGRSLVYCTEPFRISFAGRLDVVCFDKTGTLTKDQMLLRGLVAAQEISFRSNTTAAAATAITTTRTRATTTDGGDGDAMLEAVPSQQALEESSPSGELNKHGAMELVMAAESSPDVVLTAMGCCHDLMTSSLTAGKSNYNSNSSNNNNKQKLIGDPLEVATLTASGFEFAAVERMNTSRAAATTTAATTTGAMSMLHHKDRGITATILKKYPFSSDLKRMSVVARIERTAVATTASTTDANATTTVVTMAFSKGAPEVIAKHLKEVPAFYNATYYHHMCRGRRVLALAVKHIPTTTSSSYNDNSANLPRSEVESELQFAGFLVYDCDLKADSKSVVRELRSSNHRVVMITGDSVYTAADVARRLGMLKTATAAADATTVAAVKTKAKKTAKPLALILLAVSGKKKAGSGKSSSQQQEQQQQQQEQQQQQQQQEQQQLVWRQLGEAYSSDLQLDVDDIEFSLGHVVTELADDYSLCITGSALSLLQQQHRSLRGFHEAMRLLCPHATIFARVSPAQKEAILLALNEAGKYTLMCGDGTNDVGALKAAHVGVSIVNDPDFESRIESVNDSSSGGTAAAAVGKKSKGVSAKDRMARAMKELHEQEVDPTIVKLGDASIASPFTARRTSIDSVLTVIRQGRCTLVTTIQVYKVLALNCLISAYMMSALYLRGLKQGDTQMTASGLIIAALFFFLSQAKPLLNIAPQKPTASIFSTAVGISILGQFAIHFSSLLAVLHICEQHVEADAFSLAADGKFQPNIVNSAVFLLSALMQVNNFVINYRGHPFTQSISENTMLWRSVQGLYAVLLIVVGGQLEPLNDLLQMAPFPSSEFQTYLLLILVANFAASYVVERFSQRFE